MHHKYKLPKIYTNIINTFYVTLTKFYYKFISTSGKAMLGKLNQNTLWQHLKIILLFELNFHLRNLFMASCK